MAVEFVTGDLFAQRDVGALGQGTNCRGAMGAGIAVEFRKRFPDMYRAYRDACRTGALTVGGMMAWELPNGRWIYNLASQDRLGADARPEALASALVAMLEHAESHAVTSVALPMIGAGIGGLPVARVREVMTAAAGGSPVLVRVVSLPAGRR